MQDKNKILPCPFCGGEADPEGWLSNSGKRGPKCNVCGATAESIANWDMRHIPLCKTYDSFEEGTGCTHDDVLDSDVPNNIGFVGCGHWRQFKPESDFEEAPNPLVDLMMQRSRQ